MLDNVVTARAHTYENQFGEDRHGLSILTAQMLAVCETSFVAIWQALNTRQQSSFVFSASL